jgi:predicted ATPase
MHLRIKDLGPIRRASLDIRPFTILIGPNNSGKSVAAMLTYAAMTAVPRPWMLRGLFPTPGRRGAGLTEDLADDEKRLLEDWVSAAVVASSPPKSGHELVIRQMDRYIESQLRLYGSRLVTQVERGASTKLSDLRRRSNTRDGRSELVVSSRSPRWSVTLIADADSSTVDVRSEPFGASLLESALGYLTEEEDGLGLVDRLEWVSHFLLFSEFPREARYLPAERSGILQSHRVLASVVVRQAPLVGIEPMEFPRLTGMVSDFISNLLSLNISRQGDFASLAAKLERQLLEGEIALEAVPGAYPELSYLSGGAKFPLSRASSMISEVAPVVLFLRYLIDAGDQLIIEEPESHLHPRSQVILARALADLVRGNVTVLATTHSDYFLTEISNAIRLGTLVSRSPDGEPSARPPVLDAKDVTAYLFRKRGRTTDVRRVRVSERDGIADDEFANVAAELYEQVVELDEKIGAQE